MGKCVLLFKKTNKTTRGVVMSEIKRLKLFINGQWVEVLEMDKVREYLYDYIYTDKIKFEDDKKKED